jgi:hypothetical protein
MTGTVYFYDGGLLIGWVPVTASGDGGTASIDYPTAPAGSHSVSALYSGDSNFSDSNDSTTLSVTHQMERSLRRKAAALGYKLIEDPLLAPAPAIDPAFA